MPVFDRIVRANHAAVADAWGLGPARACQSIVAYLKEHMVGGDTMEKEEAIASVERGLGSFRARSHQPFEQPIVALAEVEARLEPLYYDGPVELDWPAIAFVGGETQIALDRQHITRVELGSISRAPSEERSDDEPRTNLVRARAMESRTSRPPRTAHRQARHPTYRA